VSLPEAERAGLISALGNLKGYQPFSATFRKFAELNPEIREFCGMPLRKLAADSIKLRNDVAHRVQTAPERAYELAAGLREFALFLVWSRNRLPAVSLSRPADNVAMTKLEVRLV
jgi:hypothetical protein